MGDVDIPGQHDGEPGAGALMCRLFGLHAGRLPVTASFWLLDAPDSLQQQSRRNPDGAGIGVFGVDGAAMVDKQPMAAWDDIEFASAARDLTGTTFVAHVRHASTGAQTVANTHPFVQDGRLFAHNGVIAGLDELNARLAELGASALVHGETDSERMFALITAEIGRSSDIRAGLTHAIAWIAQNVPLYCANFVLATATDLWALRYPATNELWILDRPGRASGDNGDPGTLDARTDRIHARSEQLARLPSVILASEPMDDDSDWRLLDSGELIHIAADHTIETSSPFPYQPRHQLALSALSSTVARSQQPTP